MSDAKSKKPDSSSGGKKETKGVDWKVTWSVFIGIGGFIAVALLFYEGLHWAEGRVDQIVERKLTDETILRKIAAQSRPAMIFDANESIIADIGAAQFVRENGIKVIEKDAEGWPKRIRVDFIRHFANAPVLTAMYDTARVTPGRAKGFMFAWEFEVEPFIQYDADASKRVYRLELLP